MARLTEAEEIELLALLEQQNRERVSPRLEAFRDPILGGDCKPEIRIRGCRGGRGAGAKCLKIGTKIWMYDGTLKPVEEIKTGDKVMGSDSKPRNVLSTTKGNGQLYKIKQEHAIDYIVNDSHILTLKKASWCKKDKGAFMTYGLIAWRAVWISGNSEIALFCFAVVGSLMGFLIYNAYPAKVFMGDTGSLALGGVLAAIAVITQHELTLIVVGGVFVIEVLSDIIQIIVYKTTGRRVFLMAPLHHHFELLGWNEVDIVRFFWIIGFIFGVSAIVFGAIL